MDRTQVIAIVQKAVIRVMKAKEGIEYVPAAVSNRHVHLSKEDVELLFGIGHELTPIRMLSQPFQYACDEVVIFEGPRGIINKIRVLGPVRAETQLELSVTDCIKVGIQPIVRMSGELTNTPGGKLIGIAGETVINKGIIVSARHLHMSQDEAEEYGLHNGQTVSLRKKGQRPTILENVVVRAGEGHRLEVHLDTDEANAAMIHNGDLLEIVEKR